MTRHAIYHLCVACGWRVGIARVWLTEEMPFRFTTPKNLALRSMIWLPVNSSGSEGGLAGCTLSEAKTSRNCSVASRVPHWVRTSNVTCSHGT